MECTIHIDDAGETATLCLTGLVTVPELEKVAEQLTTHPQDHEGTARLWDLRKADLSGITRDAMRRVGHLVREHKLPSTGARVAVLVGKDVDFGIMRMYMATEGESLPTTVGLFRDPETAEAWLKADSDS